MARKRKPAYLKILEGMNCCYGRDERNCSDCPYDKYNERDFYGQGTADCMVKLNSDAKKWTESMTMFTTCGECVCWSKNINEEGLYDIENLHDDYGYCSIWTTTMHADEFCSRGAMKD